MDLADQGAIVINLVMAAFAYTTWLERKLLGRMQLRYGPNRAGPFGLLQPIADLVKLVRKEAFFPDRRTSCPTSWRRSSRASRRSSPSACIPFGPGWTVDGYYISGRDRRTCRSR